MESGSRTGKADVRVRRVLLVGFMGSGKTSVGKILADRLSWAFLDFDREVERRAGMSVEEIFAGHGEATFRELEERVGSDALAREEVVLASGGGWPAAEGRMDRLGDGTMSVWLRVSPETAVRRASRDGGRRPLLDVSDPVARARTLLRTRLPYYRRADLHLDGERASPEGLAREVMSFLRSPERPRD